MILKPFVMPALKVDQKVSALAVAKSETVLIGSKKVVVMTSGFLFIHITMCTYIIQFYKSNVYHLRFQSGRARNILSKSLDSKKQILNIYMVSMRHVPHS